MHSLIVCNPASGGGRAAAVLPAVERRLASNGLDVVTHRTTSLLDAYATAERAARRYDLVIALGGDGTVGACAAGLAAALTSPPPAPGSGMGELAEGALAAAATGAGEGEVTPAAPTTPAGGPEGRAVLGIVPAGGGNDTAGALGLPVNDPVGAANLLPTLPRRHVDLVRAGGRVFVDIAAVGFDAEVNRLANRTTWLRGRVRYAWAVVAQLALGRPARFTIELDGERLEVDAWFVSVANGPSYGAGIRIAPEARMDDGLLDVVIVADLPRWDLLCTFPRAFSGGHVDHPAVSIHRVAKVGIDADPAQWVFADGEPVGMLPLVFESIPGALPVLASPDAPALSTG